MKLTSNHIKLYKQIRKNGISRICSDLEREDLDLLTEKQWVELRKEYDRVFLDESCLDKRGVVDIIEHILIEFYVDIHGL